MGTKNLKQNNTDIDLELNLQFLFSWEPALETPNSRDVAAAVKKNSLTFSPTTATFELRHEKKSCSACRKDHFSCFQSFQILKFSGFQVFKTFLVPS